MKVGALLRIIWELSEQGTTGNDGKEGKTPFDCQKTTYTHVMKLKCMQNKQLVRTHPEKLLRLPVTRRSVTRPAMRGVTSSVIVYLYHAVEIKVDTLQIQDVSWQSCNPPGPIPSQQRLSLDKATLRYNFKYCC
jgi:hypothetical protein